jgi:hypothetical protein
MDGIRWCAACQQMLDCLFCLGPGTEDANGRVHEVLHLTSELRCRDAPEGVLSRHYETAHRVRGPKFKWSEDKRVCHPSLILALILT